MPNKIVWNLRHLRWNRCLTGAVMATNRTMTASPKKKRARKSPATKGGPSGDSTSPKPVRKWVAGFPTPPDKEKAKAFADLALNPNASAAAVAVEYLKPTFGEQDLGSLVDSLAEATAKVNRGDMSGCEAMLYGQAQALQDIFVTLARRAAKQIELTQWDAALRMALRAQNQWRMTLETLATIKNPRVLFATQANFAAGHQQVNNGVAPSAQARKSQIKPSKLLEANDGERMDTGTPGTASGANQELETMGAIHGAEIGRRQSAGLAQRLQRWH